MADASFANNSGRVSESPKPNRLRYLFHSHTTLAEEQVGTTGFYSSASDAAVCSQSETGVALQRAVLQRRTASSVSSRSRDHMPASTCQPFIQPGPGSGAGPARAARVSTPSAAAPLRRTGRARDDAPWPGPALQGIAAGGVSRPAGAAAPAPTTRRGRGGRRPTPPLRWRRREEPPRVGRLAARGTDSVP